MSKGIVGILGCLLLMAAIVSGCGGGDGDGSSAATALTKAEYIKQGDAICEKARQKKIAGLKTALAEIAASGAEKLTTSDQEELLEEYVLPPFSRMSQELAALEGPSDPKAAAVPMTFQKVIKELQANPEIVSTKPNAFVEADEVAGEYGFKVCNEIY